jgi:hypothetical protein
MIVVCAIMYRAHAAAGLNSAFVHADRAVLGIAYIPFTVRRIISLKTCLYAIERWAERPIRILL